MRSSPAADLFTSESGERLTKNVLPELFRVGRIDKVRFQMVNKKGHAIDILMSAAITDEPLRQGQVSLAVLTDITALSRTERLLAESEARCRNFVEEQRDLVALVSPEGKLEFANRAYDATIESAAFTIPCCPLGRSPSRR